jgi:hypothetical protein
LQQYGSNIAIEDTNYVQWEVSVLEFVNKKRTNKINLKTHKCTQEDYDQFYPPAKIHQSAIKNIRESNFGLYCIDSGQNLTISGFDSFDFRRL